jgi:glycosyltransferase involved in cell wall biosynthesis
MRLLILTSELPSQDFPHADVFVTRQADALRALGCHVRIVGIPMRRVGPVRGLISFLRLGIAGAVAGRHGDYDAVIAHHVLWPMALVARFAATVAGTPRIVIAHGSDARLARGSTRLATMLRCSLGARAKLVAVSRATADDVAAVVGREIPVIPIGVDRGAFFCGSPRGDHALEQGSRRILFAGSLDDNKNVLSVVAAVRTLAGEMPCVLIVAGDGIYRDEVAREPFVDWRPSVEPSAMAALMRSVDVLVLPSSQEGFGLVVLEAMACGTPVVATDIPVMKHVPTCCGVRIADSSPAAIRQGIERSFLLSRCRTEGQTVADELSTLRQAEHLRDLIANELAIGGTA